MNRYRWRFQGGTPRASSTPSPHCHPPPPRPDRGRRGVCCIRLYRLLRVDEPTVRRLSAAHWPRLALNGDPHAPAVGAAVRTAGCGLPVDEAPTPGGARYVDQPAPKPRQCVAWGGQQRRRGLPGWDWDRPPDHPAFVCAALWAGGCSPCRGDSGGPVYQVVPPRRRQGEPVYVQVTRMVYCSLPDYPSVSARLSAAKEWVRRCRSVCRGGGGGGGAGRIRQ